jgi:hypothetical protein
VAVDLEEPPYDLLSTHDGFEVRRYASTVQARVLRSNADGRGNSGGFRRVAGYIFGGNDRGQRIAMTAPVHLWEDGGEALLAFTMPSAHALADLPTPRDSGVHLLEVEPHTVAVLSFSGLSRPSKVARLEADLRAYARQAGLVVCGPVRLAIYDNPNTTLPFQRRNELHLPVEPPSG